jgi:hypothetical protein
MRLDGSFQASTVPQSVPFFFAGLVLLALWSYPVTLAAGADAAVTRSLLFSGGPQESASLQQCQVLAWLPATGRRDWPVDRMGDRASADPRFDEHAPVPG